MTLIALFFLAALPWLNPFASGPSPAVVPLLFSWVCVIGWYSAYSLTRPRFAAESIAGSIAMAWLVAGILSAAMGLAQYLGVAAKLMPWVSQAELGQAFANLRQRNQFATLTNIALAGLLWLAVRAQQPQISGKTTVQGWMLVFASLLAVGNAISSFVLCMLHGAGCAP